MSNISHNSPITVRNKSYPILQKREIQLCYITEQHVLASNAQIFMAMFRTKAGIVK